MITKTWSDFLYRLKEIEFEKFDIIVAIGAGGIIPGGFIQQKLGIPMKVLNLNYRDKDHNPIHDNAKLIDEYVPKIKGKKILLVDDVTRTGKTIEKAKKVLSGNDIKVCVVNGKTDYFFYREKECIKMPWKI